MVILGACVSLVVGPIVMGWREYPWIGVPFWLASAVAFHPVMDKEVPSLIGLDMLRSWRTYIGILLQVAAWYVTAPYQRAFVNRFMNAGR
jgi:hypothetical protein